MRREPEVPEESPSGRMSRWPCKDYLRGTCNNSFWERWHPPECLFYKNKNGCRFGEKCSFPHRQVDEQPTKRSKSNNDKSAVAILKKGDWQDRGIRLRCLSRSNGGNLRERSAIKLGQNLSKCRFSDARQLGLRISGHDAAEVYSPEEHWHAEANPACEVHKSYCTVMPKFETKNPSLGYICPGEPHERNPNAPKFEDRSQEETEWQEQGAREADTAESVSEFCHAAEWAKSIENPKSQRQKPQW